MLHNVLVFSTWVSLLLSIAGVMYLTKEREEKKKMNPGIAAASVLVIAVFLTLMTHWVNVWWIS